MQQQQIDTLCLFLQDRLENHLYEFFHSVLLPAAWTSCKLKCENEHHIPVQDIDIHSEPFDLYCFDEIRVACEQVKSQQKFQENIQHLFHAIHQEHPFLQSLIRCLYETQLFQILGRNQNSNDPNVHNRHHNQQITAKIFRRFLYLTVYFCADEFSRIPCVLDRRCEADDLIKRYNVTMMIIRQSIIKAARTLLPVEDIISNLLYFQQSVKTQQHLNTAVAPSHSVSPPPRMNNNHVRTNTAAATHMNSTQNAEIAKMIDMTRKLLNDNNTLREELGRLGKQLHVAVSAQKQRQQATSIPQKQTVSSSSLYSTTDNNYSEIKNDSPSNVMNNSRNNNNNNNIFFPIGFNASKDQDKYYVDDDTSTISIEKAINYGTNTTIPKEEETLLPSSPAHWFHDDAHINHNTNANDNNHSLI